MERFLKKVSFLEKLLGQRSHGISGKGTQMQPGTPRVGVSKMAANKSSDMVDCGATPREKSVSKTRPDVLPKFRRWQK
jgi:hypothetical protein